MVNLEVNIAGLKLKNPVTTASGTFGFGEEFEDFIDVLKGVRVKTQIKKHLTTLEEISGVLYLMDNSEKISIIIDEVDEEEFEALMSFLVMMGFFSDKIGIFSKSDISYYDEFYFYER